MKTALPLYVLNAFLLATVGQAAAAEGDYLVYVGSYTDAPSNSKGIYAWRFEPSSGKVTSLGLVAETVNSAHCPAVAIVASSVARGALGRRINAPNCGDGPVSHSAR